MSESLRPLPGEAFREPELTELLLGLQPAYREGRADAVARVAVLADPSLERVSRLICARLEHRCSSAARCRGGCATYSQARLLLDEKLPSVVAGLNGTATFTHYLSSIVGTLVTEVKRRCNSAEGNGVRFRRDTARLGAICRRVLEEATPVAADAFLVLGLVSESDVTRLAEAIHDDACEAPPGLDVRDEARIGRRLLGGLGADVDAIRAAATAFEEIAEDHDRAWFDMWIGGPRRARGIGSLEHIAAPVSDDEDWLGLALALRAERFVEAAADALRRGEEPDLAEVEVPIELRSAAATLYAEVRARTEVLNRRDRLEQSEVIEAAARLVVLEGVDPFDAVVAAAGELGLSVEGAVSARLVKVVRARAHQLGASSGVMATR